MASDEVQYELTIPFIVCKSEGGPFDDQSFVAGIQYAQVDVAMRSTDRVISMTVYQSVIPQLDLLCMYYGYIMHIANKQDEWAVVRFTKR